VNARQREQAKGDFEGLATRRRQGVAVEILRFLRHNKKWWLLPIVLVLVLVGAFVIVGGSSAAPLIYTLF
jgi:Family of unknown function (DUF5989)